MKANIDLRWLTLLACGITALAHEFIGPISLSVQPALDGTVELKCKTYGSPPPTFILIHEGIRGGYVSTPNQNSFSEF